MVQHHQQQQQQAHPERMTGEDCIDPIIIGIVVVCRRRRYCRRPKEIV
jgi:hypothetical protein